ncbi:related to BNA3 - Arylformamidase [Melanopsichium pennsylvanicum]|uniref:Related to BNA3 - Arylformamidase n=2 Tax=Melanopsichium pennsylvanicum TaxID=63383 RepID=A0AAJ5C837_9BASI|nr:related to BNA3-Arylformamidase [Melanopsichium pennsylvanicum 4]SNX87571.1 related to BNA3 - Arylformamidase [Melanopsichium pennsylvanicum]
MSSTATPAPTRWATQRADRIHQELNSGVDVWTLFNPVVFPTAINLGQGFMNWKPPAYILNTLTTEFENRVDLHHYSHPKGRPRLRQAISDFYSSEFHLPSHADQAESVAKLGEQRPASGRKLDVEREIQVTSGANGGIYSIMGAFINHGDGVVCIEPFFDQYDAEIVFHGGVPLYVPLLPPSTSSRTSSNTIDSNEWTLDMELLEQHLSKPSTKALILNTPHNPVGKVFSPKELGQIAQLCVKYDILVVSDEVYDCLTFDSYTHTRIASLNGMWDRTITVGSAGKSFACTGWRVGWLIGPDHLIGPARVVHTRITFAVNSSAQEGAAIGLESASKENFFPTQIQQYAHRRHLLSKALDHIGLQYTVPHGGYFIIADASKIQIPTNWVQENQVPHGILSKEEDYLKAWFIAKVCDVVVIPATAFYSEKGAAEVGKNYVRFSFCKDDQIEIAAPRLKRLIPYLKQD